MENDIENIISVKQLLSNSINLKYYDYIMSLINKNVKDCNLLYTQVCYLIKLFLLYDYENDNTHNDYKFDENFIRFCFRLIKTNGSCNKNIESDTILYRLFNFYTKFNSDINNDFKFICPDDICSIIHITDALSRDIQTNITNNIITNFFKYIKEYVNVNLKLEFDKKIIDIDNNVINIDSKIINNVFNDIVNNTLYSNSIFHNWIVKNKKLILPNIENNIFITSIKEGYNNHNKIFIQHVKKYINSDDELHHLIKINCDKNINKLIKSITSDILNGTYESDIKYHDWIKNNEILIINKFNEFKCVELDKELEKNPYNFIPFMLFINKNLEINNSKKKYQIIPLRTNLTPKFIPIGIDSFVDILNSNYLLGNIKNFYHDDNKQGLILFDTYFNFTSKYITKTIKKGYIFSGMISTNGYEIIFYFNSKIYNEKKNKFHLSGKEERKFIKESTKNLSDEEKKQFLILHSDNKDKKKKDNENIFKEKIKNENERKKKEEQDKIKKIKPQIDLLNKEYNKNLNDLMNKYYKSLNDELNEIDKTKIENKDNMNIILNRLKDKLSSDKAFITHCYERNYNSLINDQENNFKLNYDKLVELDKENDKNIIEIKKNIKIKKNELKIIKKQNKIKNIITIKISNNTILNKKEKILKVKRLMEKIRINIEQLKYQIKDKKLYTTKITEIKLNLIRQTTELFSICKSLSLYNYLNEICNNDIHKLEEIILMKTILEIISMYDICLKYLSIEMSTNNNEYMKKLLLKITTDGNNDLNRELNKTKEYRKKHKLLLDELTSYSNKLNKLLKIKNNNENKLIKLFKTKTNECMQIDTMNNKSLEILKELNWVVIDPGMNSLLTMLSKDGKTSYTYSKQHNINRTNRNKMMKKIEKIKKEKIKKIENKLTLENERLKSSNNYNKFKLYYSKKMEIHNEIEKLYNDERLNKLKWHMFINEKRSEKMLVNDIKKKFGKKVVLIIGDWSMNKKGIKVISTPNKKYEKILEKNFIMLKINEFRTSIIHNKKEKKCENYIKKEEKEKMNIKNIYYLEKLKERNEEKYNKVIKDKKIHKILVCKTNEKFNEYVNRDKNSVKNMIKIVNSYIETNHKPKTFVLGTKICNNTLCVM